MKIKTLKLTQITPYANNPRHNSAAVETVKASIEQYGYNNPIIVDQDNVILAGHTRYKALQELDTEKCKVIQIEVDAKTGKAYRLADNKAGEISTWDMDKLVVELRSLDSMEVFFPNIDGLLQDPVTNFAPMTSEQIQQKADELTNQFDPGSAVTVDKLEINCPHCQEVFYLDKDYVKAQMGIE